MKYIKIIAIFVLAILIAVSVSAESELPDPGITPDSSFYFIDRMFSGFKSNEALADERASEIVAMAQKGHERGLIKAREGYVRAMEKRQQDAEEDEDVAEEVVWQTSNHLAVLARVREQVSEQAKEGIDRALTESAKGRENALASLEKRNHERSILVAELTLSELMGNVPKNSQESLQIALEAGKANRNLYSGRIR